MTDFSATITALPQPTAAPAVQTREQLEALLENITQLQRERDDLHHEMEAAIAALRQKYRPQLDEMERLLDVERSWAETWARANPGQLDANRSLACGPATIGFEPAPVHIERASRRWTWSRVAQTLADLPWGARYLRLPPAEVDKDALLADLAKLSPEDLRTAGMKVLAGDRFFVTCHAVETFQEAA
jgi:hypothetical protein